MRSEFSNHWEVRDICKLIIKIALRWNGDLSRVYHASGPLTTGDRYEPPGDPARICMLDNGWMDERVIKRVGGHFYLTRTNMFISISASEHWIQVALILSHSKVVLQAISGCGKKKLLHNREQRFQSVVTVRWHLVSYFVMSQKLKEFIWFSRKEVTSWGSTATLEKSHCDFTDTCTMQLRAVCLRNLWNISA